ncbi:MAG TPA: cysteine desulfurase-like protein [Sphingomonadaceae bacterium]|nr:cysteine desulfurase-like protein [Sphingomonadaceae bacterium]
MSLNIDAIRAEFPALAVRDGDRPRIYFDAPGGTQLCRGAIDAMVAHMTGGTANKGGAFTTSAATDALVRTAREGMADLLGGRAEEIAFGPNMTTLTFMLSRALARGWRGGDEVVVTRLDHDANVAPWLLVARDLGMTVRWLDFDPGNGRLMLDMLPELLSARTRLVAVGAASNALGTVSDIAAIVRTVRACSSAMVFVDAVQLVPHLPVDARVLGCDFLACSPYKFFGPHQGVLWGRADLLDTIDAYKLRPSASQPPAVRFETGTASFEAVAGTLGAVEHLASQSGISGDRRSRILAGMQAIAEQERALIRQFLSGLAALPRVRLYGPPDESNRVPTFSFTVEGHSPRDVAAYLAERGIFAWSGNFYAPEAIARLGLTESGGLVRVGFCHYTSASEVDTLLDALAGFPVLR